jgi:hypothetical protein
LSALVLLALAPPTAQQSAGLALGAMSGGRLGKTRTHLRFCESSNPGGPGAKCRSWGLVGGSSNWDNRVSVRTPLNCLFLCVKNRNKALRAGCWRGHCDTVDRKDVPGTGYHQGVTDLGAHRVSK